MPPSGPTDGVHLSKRPIKTFFMVYTSRFPGHFLVLNSEFTVTAAQVIDVLPQPASAMRITSSNATPHSQNGNYFPAYAAAQSVLPYSSTPLRQEPQEGRALLREVHPAHQL